jgi:hypothetical protein
MEQQNVLQDEWKAKSEASLPPPVAPNSRELDNMRYPAEDYPDPLHKSRKSMRSWYEFVFNHFTPNRTFCVLGSLASSRKQVAMTATRSMIKLPSESA